MADPSKVVISIVMSLMEGEPSITGRKISPSPSLTEYSVESKLTIIPKKMMVVNYIKLLIKLANNLCLL